MPTLLFLFAAYGVCFGLMNDKAPLVPLLRKLPLFPDKDGKTFFTRMLVCPYCTGFHAGWVIWLFMRFPSHLGSGNLDPFVVAGDLVAHAFAASAFCYIADIVAQRVEEGA